MAFTLAGCLVGYVIVALVFRKFLQVNLGWGRGSLVFVAGWVLATIPGWVAGGQRAYESGLLVVWPILSYSLLFFIVRTVQRAVLNSEPIQPSGSAEGEVRGDEDIETVLLPPWTCSRCGEEIEEGFDSCWKCGNTREKS
jgi:hypothetical protein